MIVYVLSIGENSEGSHVVGVFSTLEAARECALKQEACFTPWKEWATNTWESGCDHMDIDEYELQPVE